MFCVKVQAWYKRAIFEYQRQCLLFIFVYLYSALTNITVRHYKFTCFSCKQFHLSIFCTFFDKNTQVMISLGYHEKGPKTLLTSIAPSSMIRKRYKISFSIVGIIFCLTGCRTNWFVNFFPLNKGRASWRWNLLVVRVSLCSWKHFMGFWSSLHCNMGYILMI